MSGAKKNLKDRILVAHKALDGSVLNGTGTALHALRKEGIRSFSAVGFPLPREEAWKYTPVTRWLSDSYEFLPQRIDVSSVAEQPTRSLEGYHVLTLNGRLLSEYSTLPPDGSGAVVCSIQEAVQSFPELIDRHLGRYADHRSESFPALNTAFLKDGLFIYLRTATKLDQPLYITEVLHEDGSIFHQPRLLLIADKGSQASIVQICEGAASATSFENAVAEFYLASEAVIDHYHVFDRGDDAQIVETLNVYQEGRSHFSTNHVAFSGSLIRSNLNLLPDGEECETRLFGLVVARGKAHVDVHSLVDHAQPSCMSNELYKFILDDEATGVFNGKVLVRQDAQQTNAYQTNRSILLSSSAHMYSKPELEIYADDVKCSHGATTGQLDDEAIFYLRSRGLTKNHAKMLLLEAFAKDVLDLIEIDPLRERLIARLMDILSASATNNA